MSTITRLDTSERFSEAVVHGGVVYLAGQVPDAAACDVLEADGAPSAYAQTRSVLEQVDALLARAGSDKSRLLSATVYIVGFDAAYASMNRAWVEWLPAGSAPARATVGSVTLAKKEWLVEIVVTAAVGADARSAQ